ncbi:MAG: MBL fold metallo-hydrolase [Thermoanaerobaculia bacterium]
MVRPEGAEMAVDLRRREGAHCRRTRALVSSAFLGALALVEASGCSRDSAAVREVPGTTSESAGAPALEARSGPFVRVLGTVQDGGLPHVACSCDHCDAARGDPARRRWIASLALVLPESRRVYLFDATPDLGPQLELLRDVRDAPARRVDRAPVDGVFLTHAHIGHYLGLAFFGYEAVHTSGVRVYSSSRMADFLRHNGPWSQLVELDNIRLLELSPDEPVELEPGLRVTPFQAPHRDEYADTLGFTIQGRHHRLLYLPDTDSWEAWPRPVEETLEEVDFALLDGTFFSPAELPGRDVTAIGHPLITTTMDLLQRLVERGRTAVFFTHLNHSNPALDPHSEARRQIDSRGFRVLYEGQEFPL